MGTRVHSILLVLSSVDGYGGQDGHPGTQYSLLICQLVMWGNKRNRCHSGCEVECWPIFYSICNYQIALNLVTIFRT